MSITFLDGGMGQELVARAGKATSLWSVQALIDDPEAVLAVHNEYFVAGADVATTNTYSILPDRLEKHGLLDHLEKLQKLACQLASDARDLNGKGIVAGSMLVFIPATGEYVIPDLLGGGNVQMIGRQLYNEFAKNIDWPVASAVAIVLLLSLIHI